MMNMPYVVESSVSVNTASPHLNGVPSVAILPSGDSSFLAPGPMVSVGDSCNAFKKIQSLRYSTWTRTVVRRCVCKIIQRFDTTSLSSPMLYLVLAVQSRVLDVSYTFSARTAIVHFALMSPPTRCPACKTQKLMVRHHRRHAQANAMPDTPSSVPLESCALNPSIP